MPKTKTSIAIDEEILEQTRHLSDSQYRSVSQTVEMLLAGYIAQHRLTAKPAATRPEYKTRPANQPSS